MDRIAERIRLSEYRINGGRKFFLLPLSDCPLLLLAAGLICGILLQSLSGAVWLLLTSGGVCAGGLLAAWLVRRDKLLTAGALGFCAFFILGAGASGYLDNPPPDNIASIVPASPAMATIKGVAAGDVSDNFRESLDKDKHGYSVSFYMDVKEVLAADGKFKPATGKIYARVSFVPFEVSPGEIAGKGDYLKFYCELSKPSPVKERWRFDFGKYLYTKGVTVCGYGKYPAIKILRTNGGKRRDEGAEHLRSENDEAAAGFIDAITLGRRGRLDEDVVEAFKSSGLMHILSLSGMHVGIITFGLWWVLRAAGLRQRLAAAIVIAAIAVFLSKVVIRPPVIRACVIAFVFAAGKLTDRKVSPMNALSLAAIVTLLINPRSLFTAGWQLSFLCVFGIVVFTAPISIRLHSVATMVGDTFKIIRNKPPSRPHLEEFRWARIGSLQISAASVSLAAWASSAPVVAYHFGVFHPFSWLYSLILSPLLLVTVNVALLGEIFGAGFQSLAVWLADAIIWFVRLFADVPGSEILTGFIPLEAVLAIMASMAVCSFSIVFFNKHLKRLSAVIVVLAAGIILVWNYENFGGDKLRLFLLPAGHGQCVVIEAPGEETIMLDCGSITSSECGRWIASPFLRSRRIRELDRLIVSHPHSDHINGLSFITQNYSPKKIYCNQDCLRLELPDKILVDKPKTIIGKEKRWRLELLPPKTDYDDLNENCLVAVIDYKSDRIMLPSDIEKQRQQELMRLGQKADILLSPHHGSPHTTLEDFAEEIGAERVISTAPKDSFSLKALVFD